MAPACGCCSFLIARGAVEFDHGARALGLQHGVVAVLKKHLEQRDRNVAALLPPELGRGEVALPIGRMRDGALIIGVRDPSGALHARLSRVVAGKLVLAVAPAHELQRVIDETLVARAVEFDIDVDPGVSGELDVNLDDGPSSSFDDLLIEDLDTSDAPRTEMIAAVRSRSLPVDIKPIENAGTAPHDSLESALAALTDVDDLDWLFAVVKPYLEKTWKASLLLALRNDAAIGIRGHGVPFDRAISRISLPINEPSLLQRARDTRRVVHDATLGAADTELAAILAEATNPIAVAVTRGTEVTHVIAVGDLWSADPEFAAVELSMLADADRRCAQADLRELADHGVARSVAGATRSGADRCQRLI